MLKTLVAFLAAAVVSASVAWAQGVTPGSGPQTDLPDLGSPANAAISIEE